MKKTINAAIIGVVCLMVLFGIITIFSTLSSINPKTYVISADSGYYHYAKDGRIMVDYVVVSEDEYRYVKSDKIEVVSSYEFAKREVKYSKIVMDKANAVYKADETDANKRSYEQAKASYKSAVATKKAHGDILFLACLSSFFDPYMIIIALAGIGFLINKKIDYKKEN